MPLLVTTAASQFGTVMGTLRMIKMFAWESKINERLREKREEELVWIRKGRIMNLLNMNLKCVLQELEQI